MSRGGQINNNGSSGRSMSGGSPSRSFSGGSGSLSVGRGDSADELLAGLKAEMGKKK